MARLRRRPASSSASSLARSGRPGSRRGPAGSWRDLRRDRPYDGYARAGGRARASASAGDVAARFHVRAQEAHASTRPARPRSLDRRCRPARSGSPLAAEPAAGRRRGRRRRGAAWRVVGLAAGRRGRARSTGSTCARRRSPTGRSWRPRCRATSCPTSRSSTRASSSATPARTADHAARRPRRFLRPLRTRAADLALSRTSRPLLAPAVRGLPEVDAARCDCERGVRGGLSDRRDRASARRPWAARRRPVRLLRRLRDGLPDATRSGSAARSSSPAAPATALLDRDADRAGPSDRCRCGPRTDGDDRRSRSPGPSIGGLGRSLHVRHLDAGSCNGCDWEIAALLNPYHDIQRLGIDFVASPRHADLLLVTGVMTRNLEEAARSAPTRRCPSRASSSRWAPARSAAASSPAATPHRDGIAGTPAGRRLRAGLPAAARGPDPGSARGGRSPARDRRPGPVARIRSPGQPPAATRSASTSRSSSALPLRWP